MDKTRLIIIADDGDNVSGEQRIFTPESLRKIDGKVIIERIIEYAQEAGIDEIVVAAGYLKYHYYYLIKKYGICFMSYVKDSEIASVILNNENNSAVFVCTGMIYPLGNPFLQHFSETTVLGINDQYRDKPYFNGIFFLAKKDTEKYCKYLREECSEEGINSKSFMIIAQRFCESVQRNVVYAESLFNKYDSVMEMILFDEFFLEPFKSRACNIICQTLDCSERDIKCIYKFDDGFNNTNCSFKVNGKEYVFRFPAIKREILFCNREREVLAEKAAKAAMLDNTVLYIDKDGYKLSELFKGALDLQLKFFTDIEFVKNMAKLLGEFHRSHKGKDYDEKYHVNPLKISDNFFEMARTEGDNIKDLFRDEIKKIEKLYKYTQMDGFEPVLCHNDFYWGNILYDGSRVDIIDWEYAGVQDPAFDLGRVLFIYDITSNSIDEILEAYMGRKVTDIEKLHFIAYIAIHFWCWFSWTIFRDSLCIPTGEWMRMGYEIPVKTMEYVLPKYIELYGDI